jgi:glycosyltransferase involved in cell wall biosynthesis
MIGDGAKKAAAVKLSEQLGVGSKFSFLGAIPHNKIPHLISNSDLLVALYLQRYMAIPIKILEYGAAKKPILTSKNVARIFENEIHAFDAKDHFCFVDSNVESIANAMIELFEDKKLRNRIARNMYKMTAENFSQEIISNKYLSLFRTTLEIRRAKPKKN